MRAIKMFPALASCHHLVILVCQGRFTLSFPYR